MNSSSVNLFLSTCLKFDRCYTLKFVVHLPRNLNSHTRYIHYTHKCLQDQKNRPVVLPSPLEEKVEIIRGHGSAPAKSSAKQTLPYHPLLEPFRRIFRPLLEKLWIRPEHRNFRHPVTLSLRKNEYNKEFTSGSIKSYDSNQLASNNPIEDTRCEAQLKHTPGIVMGIFDGHGGPACAQVVSTRLSNYIAAALLPKDVLTKFVYKDTNESFVESYNEKVEIVQELKTMYEKSFNDYLQELLKEKSDSSDVSASLEKSIMKLDNDISKEVLDPFETTRKINPRTLSVAMSGAVACVSHVAGPHLHVANVGDCCVVLGTLAEDNEWIAKKITKEHNAENYEEVKRIWSEHPESEKKTVIKRDRLLGELAPLRSLGDYRYKWSTEVLSNVAVPLIGDRAIPANYHTPPYLTAKPDIFYHRLTPKDRFLIMASDGLWDMLTPLQAVKLVGEHMKGKVFFNPLKLPRKDIQLGDINTLLLHRKESLKSKPKDRNAATHLIRHAIGGTEYGVDHSRLAHLLSLAPDVSRMFRDDITVTVVYFDAEFLRQCPA